MDSFNKELKLREQCTFTTRVSSKPADRNRNKHRGRVSLSPLLLLCYKEVDKHRVRTIRQCDVHSVEGNTRVQSAML